MEYGLYFVAPAEGRTLTYENSSTKWNKMARVLRKIKWELVGGINYFKWA